MLAPVESKHNSVLEVALLAEAPKQWEQFQKSRVKRAKSKAKWQREIDEIDDQVANVKATTEELRRKYNPELIRINSLLERKLGSPLGGLKCPKCHEGDRGNKMNGKPWCFKCNMPLELPNSTKKRFPDIKVLPKTKRIETTFKRLGE